MCRFRVRHLERSDAGGWFAPSWDLDAGGFETMSYSNGLERALLVGRDTPDAQWVRRALDALRTDAGAGHGRISWKREVEPHLPDFI